MSSEASVAVICTALPKTTLSCKWRIEDATIFLTHHSQLRSKRFSLRLPSNKASASMGASDQMSSWFLGINKKDSTTTYTTTYPVYLYQGNITEPKPPTTKVLLSDCVFSFINPETNEVLWSQTKYTSPPYSVVEITMSEKICCHLYNEKDIKNVLVNGALTMQVNATLHSYMDPVETLDVVSDVRILVPPDSTRDKMHDLYKEEAFTDVTIMCGDKEFKVHRVILASQSAVFKKMFKADMKEKQSSIVNISDIPPAVMTDLVTYLYTGAAPNMDTLAKELLNAADKYELPRLFAMCEKEMKMNIKVDNIVDTLILADLHTAVELKQACLNFIHLNSAEVHKTAKWNSLRDEHGMLLIEVLEHFMKVRIA